VGFLTLSRYTSSPGMAMVVEHGTASEDLQIIISSTADHSSQYPAASSFQKR